MLMQKSKVLKIILFLCGAAILVAGVMALFNTNYFASRNGIEIAGNLSLLNDYKAMGGLFIGVGVIMLLGIIHERMAFTSTVVAAVSHLTIALGRFIAILSEGIPAEGLVKATIVEAVLGLLAVFALMKYRDIAAKTNS